MSSSKVVTGYVKADAAITTNHSQTVKAQRGLPGNHSQTLIRR